MPNKEIIARKGIYQFKEFNKFGALAAFSDRRFNLGFSNNTKSRMKADRIKFLKELGVDYRDLVCARQVHKTGVVYVNNRLKGKGALTKKDAIASCDGFITDKVNIPVAVFTADCLSIFLLDKKNNAISLLHCGWRSTKGGIVSKAVSLMKKKFKTDPKDLLVAFGPAMRECCYEVRREFKKHFPETVKEKNGLFYFDLVGENHNQLFSLGVRPANIIDANICTACNTDKFYSYRREGESAGRLMSVAMLRRQK